MVNLRRNFAFLFLILSPRSNAKPVPGQRSTLYLGSDMVRYRACCADGRTATWTKSLRSIWKSARAPSARRSSAIMRNKVSHFCGAFCWMGHFLLNFFWKSDTLRMSNIDRRIMGKIHAAYTKLVDRVFTHIVWLLKLGLYSVLQNGFPFGYLDRTNNFTKQWSSCPCQQKEIKPHNSEVLTSTLLMFLGVKISAKPTQNISLSSHELN